MLLTCYTPFMRKLIGLIGLAAILMLAGCASKNKLVGTWTGNLPLGNGINCEVTQTFNGDGTSTGQMTLPLPGMDKIIVRTKGKYRLEADDKLVSSASEFTYENVPPQFEKALKPQIEQNKDKEMTATLAWTDDDTVTMTTNGQTLTMTRKKS